MLEVNTLTHHEPTRKKIDAIRQQERIDYIDINTKAGQMAAREAKEQLV